MKLHFRLFGLFLGLSAGNFAHQFFAVQDWALAFDRSFFQFAALFAFWAHAFMTKTDGDFYP